MEAHNGGVVVVGGFRPDISVLEQYGVPQPLSGSVRLGRPRWPYCSKPWCPGNRAYVEDLGVYVSATEPLEAGVRIKVYAGKRTPPLEPLPFTPTARKGSSVGEVLKADKYDVLIVGGGVSGLSAALAAAEHGLRVLVVESSAQPGGIDPFIGLGGDVVEKAKSHPGITILTSSIYVGLLDEGHIAISESRVIVFPEGKPVVYSAGCESPPPLAPNNDLPGIVSLRYAAELLAEGYRPKRIVVLGWNPWADNVAGLARSLGVDVVAVKLENSKSWCCEPTADVSIVEGSAVAFEGSQHFERVVVDGEPVEASLAASALPPYPDAQAAYAVGYKPVYCPAKGVIVPEPPEPSVSWLRARGNVIPAGCSAGAEEPSSIRASASYAAALAALVAGRASEEDARAAYTEFTRSWGCRGHSSDAIVGEPPPVWVSGSVEGLQFVDLEEDVTLSQLLEAWDAGYKSLEMVKRVTGLGMGLDQGRFSIPTAALLISHLRSLPLDSIEIPRPRPPLMPLAIGSL